MGERQQRFSGTRDVRPEHRFATDRLEAYLSEQIDGFRALLSIRQFKGGQSNPTYLLEADDGRRFVLRRKPPGELLPSAHAVDREYRVLSALGEIDFPVPATHCLCTDESIVGTWFFVMDFVPGRIFWEHDLPGLEPQERGALYDAMNEVLARLHGVDYAALGLTSYGKPGNYFARQIHRWTKQYRASETATIEAMDRLIAWLPEHVPQEDETSIVHGDYRLDNIIFAADEPRVVAVLDWELGTLGHPLGDFSYHCMQWVTPRQQGGLAGSDLATLGIPDLETYIAAYCRRTGRSEISHWNFYLAYNLFRSAAIAQGIAGRVRDGTAASAHAAEVGAAVPFLAQAAWDRAQQV